MKRPAPDGPHVTRNAMPRVFWRMVISGLLMLVGAEAAERAGDATVPAVLSEYCANCHDGAERKGGLNLEPLLAGDVARHSAEWEKVVRKMRTRQMPPAGKDRPSEAAYDAVLTTLTAELDSAAARHPRPGRTESFRRLNRTEYRNAIRDLLAVEIDAAALLPPDESSHGFDNVTVNDLSPTLLNRYISAAEKISRLAVGAPLKEPEGDTFRLPPDRTQEDRVEGLPPGTRGGVLLNYTFPRDGVYEIQVRLTRDRNEEVEGLREPHELDVILDRELQKRFTVAPPKDRNFEKVDAHLKVRVPIKAGPRGVGVTFVKKSSSLLETKRQPYLARYNMHRHPRLAPAVYQVSIIGPYESEGPGDTPSRRRIFVVAPVNEVDEDSCAERILGTLVRRAFRRPISAEDLAKPMAFYREAKAERGFEGGIEAAIRAVLVSPEFLFRIEREPEGAKAGTVYSVDDIALASRLSFFLWSSIPDDELLAIAERGELRDGRVLEGQVRRMLADPRAENLVTNFAEQWLHLRNLESLTPDLRLFPEFDDNLREAFRRETDLHLNAMWREDRSVLDLLKADHTFLNERLAKHYGIPDVHGSRFRRVSLDVGGVRGGLLRQGSVLAVTSYATRTSPVIRGKWVLENVLGTPPPPPLPDVPALKDNTVGAKLSVRERLAEHRANAACASCHNMMDPVGFALENYDAIGRWRDLEEGEAVDASGGLPDGTKFSGVGALEDGLLRRPEIFVSTLTEKLLTFALGRGVEADDAPAVRKIVREAQPSGYRFSAVIAGVVRSVPFTMRKTL